MPALQNRTNITDAIFFLEPEVLLLSSTEFTCLRIVESGRLVFTPPIPSLSVVCVILLPEVVIVVPVVPP